MTRPIGSGTVLLAEVPEALAVGSLAEAYADIRRVLGVAKVALVYRALAAQPGRLEGMCSALRPNLASAQARTLAAGLSAAAVGSVAPVPTAVVERAALGLEPTEDDETRRIVSRFCRAIPSMIVVTRLIEAALIPAFVSRSG